MDMPFAIARPLSHWDTPIYDAIAQERRPSEAMHPGAPVAPRPGEPLRAGGGWESVVEHG